MIKNADITATINLNDKSATLGDITAQEDDTGARVTHTTVNLNGSGWLGADEVYAPGHAPTAPNYADTNTSLVLSTTAPNYFDTVDYSDPSEYYGVRVLGVDALNKTGAGTFVITGAPYEPASTPAGLATWTLDVGAFNIKQGEIQLNVGGSSPVVTVAAAPTASGDPDEPVFGIHGDVNNDATLVVGRRIPVRPQLVGNTLVNSGGEVIDGITVDQTGNFNQSSTGTTVVGLDGGLVRFGPLGIPTGSTSTEPLGVVSSGVGIPYFTTPANAAAAGYDWMSTHSLWNVTGNINLAGTVQADVNPNSIFVNGDGYVIFTYTGTATVTANASSTSPSSAATSPARRTSWSGSTPSASPATCSGRCAATAGRSSTRPPS